MASSRIAPTGLEPPGRGPKKKAHRFCGAVLWSPPGHRGQIGKRAGAQSRHLPMCFHVTSPVPVRTYSLVRNREAISGSRSSVTGPGRKRYRGRR